jgi:hypothetical protein
MAASKAATCAVQESLRRMCLAETAVALLLRPIREETPGEPGDPFRKGEFGPTHYSLRNQQSTSRLVQPSGSSIRLPAWTSCFSTVIVGKRNHHLQKNFTANVLAIRRFHSEVCSLKRMAAVSFGTG